ncbi:hypothetical protein BV22DRAFT_984305, partial [Leucogyrophana mollusca]
LDALVDHRNTKSHGVRANNLAAARDMLSTSDRIIKEMDSLAACTGAYVCLFLTRGNLNCSGHPTWYSTHNSMDFWEDVMKLNPDDITQHFEQWACSRDQMGITGKKDIKMNYMNYDKSIVELHHIKLVGWPDVVKFTNPSLIGAVTDIRSLRDALTSGECHW